MAIQNVEDYYNKMASDYEESMFGWGYCMPEAIADALVRHGGLQMEASILDLGCGNGLCGQALYNRGIKDINGIDFSRCVRKSNNKDTTHLRDSISKLWKNMRRTCHILYYYIMATIGLLYEDVHFDRDFGGGYEKVEILGSIFLIKKWFEKKMHFWREENLSSTLLPENQCNFFQIEHCFNLALYLMYNIYVCKLPYLFTYFCNTRCIF